MGWARALIRTNSLYPLAHSPGSPGTAEGASAQHAKTARAGGRGCATSCTPYNQPSISSTNSHPRVAFSFCEVNRVERREGNMAKDVMMSKEEMIAAIQDCAAKLGHQPSIPELKDAVEKLSMRTLRKHFSTYAGALRAAGIEPKGFGLTPLESMFKDWARVVRVLGKVPTIGEYEGDGEYSSRPIPDAVQKVDERTARTLPVRRAHRHGRRLERRDWRSSERATTCNRRQNRYPRRQPFRLPIRRLSSTQRR